eukprot:3207509-Rhodomonas_salina.1
MRGGLEGALAPQGPAEVEVRVCELRCLSESCSQRARGLGTRQASESSCSKARFQCAWGLPVQCANFCGAKSRPKSSETRERVGVRQCLRQRLRHRTVAVRVCMGA